MLAGTSPSPPPDLRCSSFSSGDLIRTRQKAAPGETLPSQEKGFASPLATAGGWTLGSLVAWLTTSRKAPRAQRASDPDPVSPAAAAGP